MRAGTQTHTFTTYKRTRIHSYINNGLSGSQQVVVAAVACAASATASFVLIRSSTEFLKSHLILY